jgi:hypothetical protein
MIVFRSGNQETAGTEILLASPLVMVRLNGGNRWELPSECFLYTTRKSRIFVPNDLAAAIPFLSAAMLREKAETGKPTRC